MTATTLCDFNLIPRLQNKCLSTTNTTGVTMKNEINVFEAGSPSFFSTLVFNIPVAFGLEVYESMTKHIQNKKQKAKI